jgi:hypothetical protein
VPDEDTPSARLTGGARRGPLEDSGGLPGYENILEALADPTHPDHTDFSEWVLSVANSDEPFDRDLLDIDHVNQMLASRRM